MVVSERVLTKASSVVVAASLAIGGATAPAVAVASEGTATQSVMVSTEKATSGTLVSKEASVNMSETRGASMRPAEKAIIRTVSASSKSDEVASASYSSSFDGSRALLYQILFVAPGLVPQPDMSQYNPLYQQLLREIWLY